MECSNIDGLQLCRSKWYRSCINSLKTKLPTLKVLAETRTSFESLMIFFLTTTSFAELRTINLPNNHAVFVRTMQFLTESFPLSDTISQICPEGISMPSCFCFSKHCKFQIILLRNSYLFKLFNNPILHLRPHFTSH